MWGSAGSGEGGSKLLNKLRDEIHQNAKAHGWWENEFTEQEITEVWARLSATPGLRDRVVSKMKEQRSFGDIIALCHSELSEALEEHRNGHKPTEVYYSCVNLGCVLNDSGRCNKHLEKSAECYKEPKLEGIPIELADCIIRILDYCGKEGIDIEEAISIKHEYNKTRPYKHGGKVI
jgi:NTP pyrophosphatase (non-canonical NTP hydrolase)